MKRFGIAGVFIGFLITIAFVAAYWVLNNFAKQELTDTSIDSLNTVINNKFTSLRQYLNRRDNDADNLHNLISEFVDNRKIELKTLPSEVLREYSLHHQLQNIYIFNTSGMLIAKAFENVGSYTALIDQLFFSNFQDLYRQEVINTFSPKLSPAFPSLKVLYENGVNDNELLNKRLIFYITPLIVEKKLIGLTVFADEVSQLELLRYEDNIFANSGRVMFVETDGEDAYTLLRDPENNAKQKILKNSLADKTGLIQESLSQPSGMLRSEKFQGESLLVQWRFIPALKQNMLVTIPELNSFELLGLFNSIIVLYVISVIVIGLVFAWYSTNVFNKSIIAIQQRLFNAVDHLDEEDNISDNYKKLGQAVSVVEKRIEHDNEVLLSAKQRLRFFMKELEDQRFAFDQHCIIVVADADGTFTDANAQFSHISGYARSELIGSSFRRFGGDYQNERIMKDILDTMAEGQIWQGELSLIKRTGERYWLETTFVPFINEDGSLRNMVAIHTDITEQKLAYSDMIHQAQYDTLTGLPNRALLMDRLGQLLRNARRNKSFVAVLFIDLDDFKKVNDTLGHEFGDELLIEVGRRLKGVIREQDTVGRLGGDEFLLLLSDTEYRDDVEIVARKVIESVRVPITVDEYELVVGASIGISMFPDDGVTESEILRNADSAMYNAKRIGRNTWSYFTEEMNKEVARRLEIESWMNDAIDRGEFSVLFQPVVSVHSGKFATVEALVRWTHPNGGTISPDEFIPIAEHSGYIIPISKFVLEQSLDLAQAWKKKFGSELIVAINASPRQFRDPDWHGGIEEQLAKRGLTTRNIEFEITEGVLISGNENVERALQEFSEQGIAIAMDDFGTGYSSLSYLRNYPFDTLKIDRSFVSDIVEDHGDFELVSAAIAMAHGLGLQVVAEGVETHEQFELLFQRRCDYAQGYLFSKPVTGDEILRMGGSLPNYSKIRQQRQPVGQSEHSKSFY